METNLNERLIRIEKSCANMDKHISFIDTIINFFFSPFKSLQKNKKFELDP